MPRLLQTAGALGVRLRAAVFHNQERRRSAQDVTAFDNLVASPAALGTAAAGESLASVTLPANADLGVRLAAATSEGDILLDVSGGRTVAIAGGAADTVQLLRWHERGREVALRRDGAPAGSVELLVLDEWLRPFVIGEGTFGSAFTPASLFAGGIPGSFLEFYDSTTLNTLSDETGTEPDAMDPIGHAEDGSGNGLDVSQATSSSRPTYQEGSGTAWSQGDGVNDFLKSAKTLDLNAPEFWVFAAIEISETNGIAFTLAGDSFQYARIDQSQVFVRAETGSSNSVTQAITSLAAPSVILARVRESDRSLTVWQDGTEVGSVSIPGTDWWPTLSALVVHAASDAGNSAASKLYAGGAIVKALTEQEQNDLTTFLQGKLP